MTTIPFDLTQFVNRVADQFQTKRRIVVDASAREALIAPALPHVDRVAKSLETKEVTIEFLEACVMKTLERARRIASAGGFRFVNGPSVQQSLEGDNPYLFWC
jgi:hypothetical protein